MHIYNSELGHHGFSQWYDDFFAPSHYLHQWWLHWLNPRNKISTKCKKKFQGNIFQNIINTMSAIFSGLNVLALRISSKRLNIVSCQAVENFNLFVTYLLLKLFPGSQETVEENIQKAELWGKTICQCQCWSMVFVLHPGAQHKIYKVFCNRMYQLWFKIFHCDRVTYCVIQDATIDYETQLSLRLWTPPICYNNYYCKEW